MILRATESIDLMNQVSREQNLQHEQKMNILVEAEEYNLFKMLKPSVSMDGNQYCVLYGSNPMEGVVGFGDTLYGAIIDFNRAFHKPLNIKEDR